MNTGKQLTVSVRAMVAVGLVALALVTAYLVGGGGHGQPANASPPAPDPVSADRTVTVTGQGQTSVVPDQLTFDVSVDKTAADLDSALSSANTAMRQVQDALESKGVTKKDLQTSDLELNPSYSKDAPHTITGYEVTETLSVVVEKLSDASPVVTAAADAGGSGVSVQGLNLQVGDPDAALSPARSAAYQQAKAKAQEYAADAGHQLGDVVRISETNDQPVDQRVDFASAASADAPVPIQAGQQDLSAQVTVVFALQ